MPNSTSRWSAHPYQHAHPSLPSSNHLGAPEAIRSHPPATPRANSDAVDHRWEPRNCYPHYNNTVYRTHTNPRKPTSATAAHSPSYPQAQGRKACHPPVASSSTHGSLSPPIAVRKEKAHRRSRPAHSPHRPTTGHAPGRGNPCRCRAW